MGKKVGVLFSGGLDSTYLVWKNLKDGNTVVPIYIEIGNNKVKTVLEKNRIELLHKIFVKQFNNADKPYSENPLKDIQYALTVDVCVNEESLYFRQVPVWLLGILFCQSLEVNEIQIGYIGNDDAISYLNDIQKIYKSYRLISENLKPLTFPIFKKRKWELAEVLPSEYLELIVSCENAIIIGSETAEIVEYEPCCNCGPCRTIISTDYYNKEFPEIYKKKLRKKRIQELSRDGYKIIDEKGNEVDAWDEMLVKAALAPHQLEINFDELERTDEPMEMCDIEERDLGKAESVDLYDKVETE